MTRVVISGTGLFTPKEVISNDELVVAYNQYASNYNDSHANEILNGTLEPLQASSTAFIEKASGIKSRHVLNKSGILDPTKMRLELQPRNDKSLSYQAEIGVAAAKQALVEAAREAKDIDLVILACSNMQRAYPAVAIEIQDALGCKGYAYDMNVACSSATFGIKAAADAIAQGSATKALVVNSEICSGHLAFKDRDCHFIFGDVATAVVLEADGEHQGKQPLQIVSAELKTQFSNNIRNNAGFLDRAFGADKDERDKLFYQNGRKVFKEVVPMVSHLILDHLGREGIDVAQIKRLWLHQANKNMNDLICRKILGRDALEEEAPIVLDEYANTSSAGSVIALHKYRSGLNPDDYGVLCSFGAGYSIGSLVLRQI